MTRSHTRTEAERAASRIAREISEAAYAAESGVEPVPEKTVTERATEVTEKAGEMASQAREKAVETAEQAREKTAEGAQTAAETIREQVQGRGGVQEAAGTRVADTMERTATYLREHDTQDMMRDLEDYVRAHPTQALLGAIAAGFIVGRILK